MAKISSITLPNGDSYDFKDKDAQTKIIASGILKGDGAGSVSAAMAGTDYTLPSQLADIEETTTASKAYPFGSYLILNGIIYQVTADIALGDTISVGENVQEVVLTDALYPEVKSVSGAIARWTAMNTAPLRSLLVNIEPVQSGTGDPSPGNVRTISGWTGCNVQNNSLPSEYQKVEYLESQSDCYILTDYYPTGKTTYKSKGAVTSSGWVFGSRTAREYGDSMGWLLTTSSNYKTFRVDYAVLQLEKDYTTATRRFRVESSYKDGTWSYVAYTGDTDSIFEQGAVAERTFTGGYPLVLFGLNNGGTISKYDGVKLFYLTLMEDNQITADFIPCYRKSDNTPGMYDIVGRKFYTNSGTGTFVTGPDISSGTTIPISWETEAGTVYGGTLDVTNGVLTMTHRFVVIDGTTSIATYSDKRKTFTASGFNAPSASVKADITCNRLQTVTKNASGDENLINASDANTNQIMFNVGISNLDLVSDWLAHNPLQVVYPLATPITYQLTPQQISSFVGENNLWADTGDVSVEYRSGSIAFLSDIPPVDSTPTQNSANPVSSGGVYTALSAKQDASTAVTNVEYDSTTAKLKKTVGGTTSDVVTLDSSPTQSSNVPVTSGGVYTALAGKSDNTIIADVEESPATSNHSVGELIIVGGVLYKVTSAIAQGDTITTGTNVAAKTVGELLEAQAEKKGTVTLSTTWSGSDPYTQTVTVTGVTITANSKVSLNPTAAQIQALAADYITALIIENNAGVLTAYAVGGQTSAAMTIDCTVTEVGA